MAASQASLVLRNSTDAEFRLWGKFVSDGLAAGGWTKMDSDINWATVVAPAQNTYAGYEVWKSPDETGLANFYVKLQYGSTNNASPSAALSHQVGWGYPGSGSSLSGVVSTVSSNISSTTVSTSSSRLCVVTAKAGELLVVLGDGAGSPACTFLTISRTRDTALAKQDNLLLHRQHYITSAPIYGTRVLSTTQEFQSESSITNVCQPLNTSYGVARGIVGIVTMNGLNPGPTSPSELFLGFTAGKLGGVGETVTISVFGTNRTYLIGTGGNGAVAGWRSDSAYNVLYLYE